MPTVNASTVVARTASDTTVAGLDGDIIHPALGLVVLVVVAVLNMHKPRGLTRYGARKQKDRRQHHR